MQVLITGSAGFIGYHLAKALARQGIATYGIDSINSYYDVSLKKARLKACGIDLSRQEQEYRSTLIIRSGKWTSVTNLPSTHFSLPGPSIR